MNTFRSTSRIVSVAAVAMALVPSVADAATKPVQPQCPDRPGRTLTVDGKLRVYQTTVQDKKDPDANVLRVFACSGRERKARMVLRLRNNLDLDGHVEKAVAGGGRWVALSMVFFSGTHDGRSLHLYDAVSGKEVADVQTPEDAGPTVGNDSSFDQVDVGKDGGLAYVSGGVLRAVDQGGARVLAPAAAPDTAAVSDVAVAGNRVYWTTTASGVASSAVLTGHATGSVNG